jgi:hypothetical protein
MTERLLQFIWQFQYFNRSELTPATGEIVQIVFPGKYNTDQGPDFSDAKIKIGQLYGQAALNCILKLQIGKNTIIRQIKNYNNVILHVVWEDDDNVYENSIPVIEMKSRVSKILLQRYEELMNSSAFIPCENGIHSVRILHGKAGKDVCLRKDY